jgi:hypothetical protein
MPPGPAGEDETIRVNYLAAGLIQRFGHDHHAGCGRPFSDLNPCKSRGDEVKAWNWKCNKLIQRTGIDKDCKCRYSSRQVRSHLSGYLARDTKADEDDILAQGYDITTPRAQSRVKEMFAPLLRARRAQTEVETIEKQFSGSRHREGAGASDWRKCKTLVEKGNTKRKTDQYGQYSILQQNRINASSINMSRGETSFSNESIIASRTMQEDSEGFYDDEEEEEYAMAVDRAEELTDDEEAVEFNPFPNTPSGISKEEVEEMVKKEVAKVHGILRNFCVSFIGQEARVMEMAPLLERVGALIKKAIQKPAAPAAPPVNQPAPVGLVAAQPPVATFSYAQTVAAGGVPKLADRRVAVAQLVKKAVMPKELPELRAVYVANMTRSPYGATRSALRRAGINTRFVVNILYTHNNVCQFLVTESYANEFIELIHGTGMRYQPNYDWTTEKPRAGASKQAVEAAKQALESKAESVLQRMEPATRDRVLAAWQACRMEDGKLKFTGMTTEATADPTAPKSTIEKPAALSKKERKRANRLAAKARKTVAATEAEAAAEKPAPEPTSAGKGKEPATEMDGVEATSTSTAEEGEVAAEAVEEIVAIDVDITVPSEVEDEVGSTDTGRKAAKLKPRPKPRPLPAEEQGKAYTLYEFFSHSTDRNRKHEAPSFNDSAIQESARQRFADPVSDTELEDRSFLGTIYNNVTPSEATGAEGEDITQ